MLRRGTFWLAILIGLAAAFSARADEVPAIAAAQELPFHPGEEVRLTLRYLKMNVADLSIAVASEQHGDRTAWPLRLSGRTKGFFNRMYSAEEQYTSFLDPDTLASLGAERVGNHDGEIFSESIRYESTEAGSKAKVHRVRDGKPSDLERDVLPGSYDVLASVYRLRTLPLAVGESFAIPVFTGKKSWSMEAKTIGHETLKTAVGVVDTLVVRCRTHFDGKFASDRDLTVWLTNDARRVPVRIEADFMVGTMSATLTEYRQGTLAQK